MAAPAPASADELHEQMLRLFGPQAVSAFYQLSAYQHRMLAGKAGGQPVEQAISQALRYEEQLAQLAA